MDYRSAPPEAPLIVVANDVVALDRQTGKVLWRYEPGAEALRFLVEPECLFVLDEQGKLHCLALHTGALLGVARLRLVNPCALLSDGERLYVSAKEEVVALDREGNELWRAPSAGGYGSLGGLGLPGNMVQPDFSRG
jgi:outer membrane protein assembly factor BamB